jgi:hypothetical protein
MEAHMELDELKQAWNTLDRRLQQGEALGARVLRESRLDRMQRGLRPLVVGQSAQLAAGVGLMLLFAPYWVEHRDTLHLALCGLFLHAYGLLFVLFAARNLYLIGRIDYSAPVLQIQRRIADLRAWRVRVESPMFILLGCFCWIPFVLVELHQLAGIDLWLSAPQLVGWLIASGVVSALAFCGLWYWTRRPKRAAWARRWDDAAAGGSVGRAQAALDELARFERE